MDFDRLLDIFAILFGVGGIGSFLLSVKRSRAQNTLDLSQAWAEFAAPLMQRLSCLEEKVQEQDVEISDLRDWAERLVKQVIALGGTPVAFLRRVRRTEDANMEGK